MKYSKYPLIELLNSEGPILIAICIPIGYLIIDEDRELVDAISRLELEKFIIGQKNIQDSRGRSWNFIKDTNAGMRPPAEKLKQFLKTNNS